MRGLGNSYNRFLAASTVSALGDGLLVTGLPLLAREATDRPVLIASVYAAGKLPWTLALVLGSSSDRRDARAVMIGSDVFRAALLALLAFMLILSSSPVPVLVLIILSALLAVGQIVFFAASQRAVPAIVTDDELENANSAFSTLTTAGEQFVGPQLGALLLTGGVLPIAGDALSFAGSAALLKGLPAIPPVPTSTSLRNDVVEGWRWFVSSRLMLSVTLVMTLVTGLSAGPLSTEIILIKDTLGKSNRWFAAFTMVLAAGAIFGSVIAPRVIKRLGASTTVFALMMTGLSYLAAAGSRSIPLVFVALFVQQVGTMIAVVCTVSMRQRLIPDHLRGRVIALSRSFAYGSQFLGALGGGWIVAKYGTDELFVVAGLLTCVIAVVAARPLQRAIHAATKAKVYKAAQ